MLKRCTNCDSEYYARWRNEPVTLCPECKAGLTVCSRCGALDREPNDPNQLALFPALFGPRRGVVEQELEDFYYTLRERASKAERRRDPYC